VRRYLLRFALVGALVLMVDATEVGHDDWDRKCYDEHAAERTNSAHNLADDRVGNHITVPAAQHSRQLAHHSRRHCVVDDVQLSTLSDHCG